MIMAKKMMTKTSNMQSRIQGIKATPRKSWYSISAAHDGQPAEILIYDEIGFFGVEAESFVRELNSIDNKKINLHINTPGGAVFDGFSIFNALKRHPAHIETHIDGLAASIGSIIALAGDVVNIAGNGFMMIHNPWALTVGNATDMRKQADVLDKIGESLAETYVSKTGKSLPEIKQIMADETWFDAKEAMAIGLVDNIIGESVEKAQFDLSFFNNAPKHLCGNQREILKPDNERDFEKFLRDAGYSRNESKAIISEGFKSIDQRDAGKGGQDNQRDAGSQSLSKNELNELKITLGV